MKITTVALFLLFSPLLYGQITYAKLLNNPNFNWIIDSTLQEVNLYYLADGWTFKNIEKVSSKISHHYRSTTSFIGLESYTPKIHLFIVNSRDQMKLLIGRETNGAAFYQYNTVTGIATEHLKSIYSNHELFHALAMNAWGVPKRWINEGMAVYADNNWHGHDLHQLAHYLVEKGQFVPLKKLINNFKKVDDRTAYPLMGSFVKFLDETYGRDMVLKIWKRKRNNLSPLIGKPLDQIEKEWVEMLKSTNYKGIIY